MRPIAHFKTITKHKLLVMKFCFSVGLYKQGILHDLSKYSPAEFWIGAKYYQGNQSPNNAERLDKGCSTAWLHHKGRNKHHFEYWTDLHLDTLQYGPIPMPTKFMVEMCMDRIAACKVYRGKDYHDGSALEYLERRGCDNHLMHPETYQKLYYLLAMLRDQGEAKTFRYIRQVVLKGLPFADGSSSDHEMQ